VVWAAERATGTAIAIKARGQARQRRLGFFIEVCPWVRV
jgi:hypothetical protein